MVSTNVFRQFTFFALRKALCEHQNVRGGHLGHNGTLVAQLQQGVVHSHLAVSMATLDNELLHVNKDASDVFPSIY